MIKSLIHHPVYWADGMKINSQHFMEEKNHITDVFRDTRSLTLTSFNYGLLPIKKIIDKEFDIFDVESNAVTEVYIKINQCSAVTPLGFRIDLLDYSVNVKTLISHSNSQILTNGSYYVLISIDPYTYIPFGDIDIEEVPPRQPFCKPKYHLHLISTINYEPGKRDAANYLIIGKINVLDNMVSKEKLFVPPCTQLEAHPLLHKTYLEFSSGIKEIQLFATGIIQKSIKSNHNTTLAESIKKWCKVILDYIDTKYFYYKNVIPQQPPIFFVEIFSSLALSIFRYVETLANEQKEEMFRYIYEWSEIPPNHLLNQIAIVSEIEYNHNDSYKEILKIEDLLFNLTKILRALNKLDYIGVQKENIIIKEDDITPPTPNKGKWNLLD